MLLTDSDMTKYASFPAALHAAASSPDRADMLGLYGRFIGDWEMDALLYRDDGTEYRATGEIHFGWVLEGRAIQGVWIFPGVFHGTTLRVYDPALDAWHILWSDPLRNYYTRQLGKAEGADIVQMGTLPDGTAIRWSFREITSNSFHWRGERSPGGGMNWR